MKINILGLGDSLSRYVPDNDITVGVNDIFKKHKVNHLLCIDRPHRFDSDRLITIAESEPEMFYSHITEWETYFAGNFKYIKLEAWAGLDSESYFYSNNSTFVACILAYKLGATEIDLYGADFNNHIHLSVDSKQQKILRDFKKLSETLEHRGVILRTTKKSLLSQVLKSF